MVNTSYSFYVGNCPKYRDRVRVDSPSTHLEAPIETVGHIRTQIAPSWWSWEMLPTSHDAASCWNICILLCNNVQYNVCKHAQNVKVKRNSQIPIRDKLTPAEMWAMISTDSAFPSPHHTFCWCLANFWVAYSYTPCLVNWAKIISCPASRITGQIAHATPILIS